MSAEELVPTEDIRSPSVRVSIVGVGGAGDNLVSHAIGGGGVNPRDCVAVNTDSVQLSKSMAQSKVLVGTTGERNWSEKRGNQRQVSLGRLTPFTQQSDFTILVAGLGGVTGTSTAPLIAQWSRTDVRPVISVVAIPFIHERERRFVALRGLKRMVEACDCTMVIDNAMQRESSACSERVADDTASAAVRGLSEIVATGGQGVSRRILETLCLGSIATICTSSLDYNDTIQSAVIKALRTPSANLPLSKAKGAVVLFRGPEALSSVQAAHAYDTITSLVGHDVRFVQENIRRPSQPSLSIFLSGYSYDMTLGAFVDFIEDLYDIEYRTGSPETRIGLSFPLYQMEDA